MNSPDTLVIGQLSFKIKPVNFRTLQRLEGPLADLNKARSTGEANVADAKTLSCIVHVCLISLVGMGLEVTEDQLLDNLDIDNAAEAIERIFNISGLKKAGEEKAVQ